MRGIYVDAGDDIEQTVLTHAVRIARYRNRLIRWRAREDSNL